MSLFLNSGFVNIRYCLNFKCPFTFIIGGRGTGKTFSSIMTCIEDNNIFMLLRRTQAQADLIGKKDFSPVNPVCDYMGLFPEIESSTKYNSLIYTRESTDEESRTLVGYTAALSTFSNLRGFDGSYIKTLIFDEFIPELHERQIKHEADTFFNVYETINRNRELTGHDPLQVLCLSNSNRLDSPILHSLNLTKKLEQMQRRGQTEYIDRDKGIAVFLLFNSPISAAKKETALYKVTQGTDFYSMSIGNSFAYDDLSNVRSLSLASGWKPLCRLGDIVIYLKNDLWYLSRHEAGEPGLKYDLNKIGIQKFVHDFPGSYQRIINNKIIYEDYSIKSVFTNIFI